MAGEGDRSVLWCSWCQRLRSSAETVWRLGTGCGPVVALHACRECRERHRIGGSPGTAAGESCVRCGKVTCAPVAMFEPGLVQCHACAYRAQLDHIVECEECFRLEARCPRASAMWQAIQQSRAKYLIV